VSKTSLPNTFILSWVCQRICMGKWPPPRIFPFGKMEESKQPMPPWTRLGKPKACKLISCLCFRPNGTSLANWERFSTGSKPLSWIYFQPKLRMREICSTPQPTNLLELFPVLYPCEHNPFLGVNPESLCIGTVKKFLSSKKTLKASLIIPFPFSLAEWSYHTLHYHPPAN